MGLSKRILAVVLAGNLLLLPLVVFSDTNTVSTNVAPVETSTNASTSSTDDFVKGKIEGMAKGAKAGNGAWFFSGCLLGVLGIILPYVIDPTVPVEDLMGKSSSYVLGYTDGFKESAKGANFKYAMYGCGVSAAAEVILYVIIIGASASSSR